MFGWSEVMAAVACATLLIGLTLGYKAGSDASAAATVKAQQAQMAAADLASRKEAERLAAETARADLSVQLEDAANAQAPDAACLPLSRVLRLNQR